MAIPEQVQALTPDDLTGVLRDAGLDDLQIISVAMEELPVTGAVSDLARVRLEYAGEAPGPESMVAKVRGESDAKQAIDAALGFFDRECWFFTEIAPDVPVRTPQAYHAGQRLPILLLEDLATLEAGDQVAGMSVTRAERIIDDLASLHSAFWESTALETRFGRAVRYSDPVWAGGMAQLAASGAPALARYEDRMDAAAVGATMAMAERFGDVLERCAGGPQTLAHNDCRLDNMFFESDGTPFYIDWHGLAVVRGTHDVAYLLAGNMDPELCRENWRGLLERYHAALVERGVRDYSWDQCVEDYRGSVLFAFMPGFATLGSLSIDSETGQRLTDALVVRAMSHASDLEAFETIGV